MVTILKYVLLGIIFYILIIPILEQLAGLICQGLETLKGLLIYRQSILQNKIDTIGENKEKTVTHAIGFTIPTEEYYEGEEDE